MMQVSLRPVCPEDEPFIFQLYAGTRLEEIAKLPWNDKQKQAFLKMQFDAQQLHYKTYFPGANHQIILYGGQPAGRLYVDRPGDAIHILDLALLPEYRNHGAGSSLLRGLLSEGQDQAKPVWGYVEDFNPALGLLERLGFHRKEEKSIHLLLEWQPENTGK